MSRGFKQFFVLCAAVFCVAILSFGRGQAGQRADARPLIVTTTAQVADILDHIGGDDIRLEYLMGPGTDPHLYRPTRSDIVKLDRADMVFYNGLHLEGQMVELLETMGENKPVKAFSHFLPQDHILHDNDGHDPHIWMDVQNWITVSEQVAQLLSVYMPQASSRIQDRKVRYIEDLGALDQGIKQAVSTIPETQRVLVTAHDAFGYLGSAYGLRVIGVQGLSTESEAGLKRMGDLTDLVTSQKIPAVFAESSVSDKNIEALVVRSKAKNHKLRRGAMLYSDAMGAEGTYESTYIGMMEHNVRQIAAALGGTKTAFLDKKQRIVRAD